MPSKMTLYDFLCMLVCGYLILCILTGTCNLLYENNLLFYALSYLIGMVYHKAVYPLLGNLECMVMRSRNKVAKDVKDLRLKGNMKNYYKCYYCLMQKNCLGNIPVLEAQAAFCKDVFFLLLIIVAGILSGCLHFTLIGDVCVLPVLLTVICIALPFVWYFTQMKIHYTVWEGAYYLEIEKEIEIDHNEKNNS